MHSSRLLPYIICLLALWPTSAPAQAVLTPAPAGMACAQNTILPALATGQFGWAQCDPNGRLYTSGVGFTPIGAYATPLSVTTTTSNALLPSGPSVTVYNTGAVPAYVTFGQSAAITATTADEVVPPGGGCGFSVYPNTYIAAITATSTTTLNVSGGTGGAMPCWGGTGSSGGGPTSNVTIVSPLGTNSIAASVAVNPATSSLWPISAASLPLPTGAATSANQPTNAAQGSTTSGQTGLLGQGAVSTNAPSYTAAQTSPLSLTTAGDLRVKPNNGATIGSTTAGTTGGLDMGAVTTSPPSYTTAQNDPLSIDVNGNLRVAVISQSSNSTYTEATLTGGSATTICGGITPINGFEIINNSTTEILYFRENGTATVAGAASAPIQVAAAYNSPRGYKPTGTISIIATTTGHAVIERCF